MTWTTPTPIDIIAGSGVTASAIAASLMIGYRHRDHATIGWVISMALAAAGLIGVAIPLAALFGAPYARSLVLISDGAVVAALFAVRYGVLLRTKTPHPPALGPALGVIIALVTLTAAHRWHLAF